MVSQDKPPTRTDRDAMQAALVEFLSVLPLVYGLKDRLILWEKIGNAAVAALETCNADLLTWTNEVLAGIEASPGRVAACAPLADVLAQFEGRSESWRAECLRVLRDLRFTLPVLARARWTAIKADQEASQ